MSGTGRPRTGIGHIGKVVVTSRSSAGKTEYTARARVRDRDGVARKISAKGHTETQAKEALVDVARIRKENANGGVTDGATIGALVDLYVLGLAKTKLAAQTKARYTQSANNHIRPAFAGLAAVELTPNMALVFIEDLAVEHLSEARTCRVVLKAIMQQALRGGILTRNPVTDASVRLAVPKSRPHAVSINDLHRLRGAIAAWRTGPDVKGPRPSTDLLDLVDIMLGTTTRIGEALAIRAEDVRIDDSGVLTVEICGTIIWEKGIGTYRKPSPKNDPSWRFITPPDFAADILRRRAHEGKWNLVFATKNGNPFLQQNLGRSLRAIVAGTDLEWITSHALRKTSATTIDRLAEGESRKAAARALGHEGETLAGTTYIERDRHVPDSRRALDTLAPREDRSLRDARQKQRKAQHCGREAGRAGLFFVILRDPR
ncbi:tyrosine-type recombinase/integrase [Cryobacterium breve]|uniref:Tyrosine-type recombinase/integrase n=1 Tax=Cryobacterium breve TaxID=1259258 RepID=A0ABY7NDW7_9MICO|nr:tyrosine-type recombinase/integrase [Cryobacterium breve]WBM80685.1 tyrosine-type recombinase/integrase [Cryobacterium breve]